MPPNMADYVWIDDNRQGSEYVSCNMQHEVTLQDNEYLLRDGRIQSTYWEMGVFKVLIERRAYSKYLLRDGRIQNPVKDLR